jgi:hypothetical protein
MRDILIRISIILVHLGSYVFLLSSSSWGTFGFVVLNLLVVALTIAQECSEDEDEEPVRQTDRTDQEPAFWDPAYVEFRKRLYEETTPSPAPPLP